MPFVEVFFLLKFHFYEVCVCLCERDQNRKEEEEQEMTDDTKELKSTKAVLF